MAERSKMFSESWHRVARQKVRLRPGLHIQKQLFQGETWHVLRDPFNNTFYRLQPAAYDFLARLDGIKTIEEVWSLCLELSPETAPGQEEIIRLLAQLSHANFLLSDMPPDSQRLLDRYRETKKKELIKKLTNILFIRIPVWDPDRFLQWLAPATRLVLSPGGALVWLVVVGLGLKVVADNFSAATSQSQGLLDPGNLFLLYLGMVLIKCLHELGHAASCRHFGGEVHTVGVMLMIFTPMPYVDATSSWAFRSRWERMFVGAAGMIAELFVAALAAFVWANTAPGTLNSLAYNMMFIASVSTLVFNINPLLRYDGYYMLSDWMEIPNLYSRAQDQLKHLFEYHLFGVRQSQSPAHSPREALWLALYAVGSGVYRLLITWFVFLFLADRFFGLGLLLGLGMLTAFVFVPMVKFIRYLSSSPRLYKTRTRAVRISLGTALAVFLFLWLVPCPNHFRAPGVLKAPHATVVSTPADGTIRRVLTPTGTRVKAGDPLLELSSRELELKIESAAAQLREVRMQQEIAKADARVEIAPLRRKHDLLGRQVEELKSMRESLVIRARHDGLWVCPRHEDLNGLWVPRGTALGEIIDDTSFQFTAIVSQAEAANLFASPIRNAQVRLSGQAGNPVRVARLKLIQGQQDTLPTAALGWQAGGEIKVSQKDPKGMTTTDTFFEVRAYLLPPEKPGHPALLQRRSGQIRFTLKPEPLLSQWWRRLQQLLQTKMNH
ncbi:MAG: biotin/lipoyl-binding protein [Verrucomicrobiae bacterium]|nr:biotin/lipoyl-binding protein [Verrucomicrobiae bacterium]